LLGTDWYPNDAKSAEDRLKHYTSRFSMVEVDSSYYGLPSERSAHLWVERTPADFIFDFKAFRLFTGHPTKLRDLPAGVRDALPPHA